MKIFLTGGTGFIGRNLKEKLLYKYKIIAPSHNKLDLLKEKDLDKYLLINKFDVLIHTAVIGGSRKEEQQSNMIEKNLRILTNLLKNIKSFKKIIILGSGAEYDKSKPIIRVKENEFGISIPKDDYGFFKYVSSLITQNTDNVIYLRLFGIYGKYEDYRLRFISNIICKNIYSKQIKVNQNVLFDYVYIDDLIKIIDYFINHKIKAKYYNIGRNKSIDLITIAKKINKLFQNKQNIIIKKKEWNNEYTCNSTRLLNEIKNFEFTDFDVSLKELSDWYIKNKSKINLKV